ncbi:hypothetical protein [Spiroplasma clarkii]|uniref:Uncharacterized protein n=1 Tax=Spiroplasma clarkii TaxID=2139 RepID=A0A2K8KH01_9MOLU|nr:hypothetical protein [Spiroplasma clarkii]ATX70955.1 hypothetical protein SCLAR_v1c06360 [Spiroplasma clarkii]
MFQEKKLKKTTKILTIVGLTVIYLTWCLSFCAFFFVDSSYLDYILITCFSILLITLIVYLVYTIGYAHQGRLLFSNASITDPFPWKRYLVVFALTIFIPAAIITIVFIIYLIIFSRFLSYSTVSFMLLCYLIFLGIVLFLYGINLVYIYVLYLIFKKLDAKKAAANTATESKIA